MKKSIWWKVVIGFIIGLFIGSWFNQGGGDAG